MQPLFFGGGKKKSSLLTGSPGRSEQPKSPAPWLRAAAARGAAKEKPMFIAALPKPDSTARSTPTARPLGGTVALLVALSCFCNENDAQNDQRGTGKHTKKLPGCKRGLGEGKRQQGAKGRKNAKADAVGHGQTDAQNGLVKKQGGHPPDKPAQKQDGKRMYVCPRQPGGVARQQKTGGAVLSRLRGNPRSKPAFGPRPQKASAARHRAGRPRKDCRLLQKDGCGCAP